MNEFDLCHFTECSFNTTQIILIAQRIESLPTVEASEDCISRETVLNLMRYWGEVYTNDKIMEMIKALPPVTSAERTGEWIGNHSGYWKCSECGLRVPVVAKGNY